MIHHFLENSAARFPDKVAIIHDDQRVTYAQVNNCANSLAHYLLSGGVNIGDRVALLLENSVDYIIAYYAALKAGAVVVPLNPGLKPDGLRYHLDDAESAVLITSYKCERLVKATSLPQRFLKLVIIRSPKLPWRDTPYIVENFEDTLNNADAADPQRITDPAGLATIIYTSGSTGRPKGVMLSHANIVANTHAICQSLSLGANDIQMVVLPFFYVMGKSLLNTHIAVGGTLVLNNRFLYPADVLRQMVDERVTAFSGVPSTYAYLLNRSPLQSSRDKLPALRYCSQAGGHMALSIKQALRAALPAHTQIFIMYGATEAAARLTCLAAEYFSGKMQSIGKPLPGVVIRLFNAAMQEIVDGQEGELVADGDNIMQGYWKDPAESRRVLSVHGYHTGDIGYRDAEGFLYVTRRKDGLLKVGGHRVNPLEIEDFMMASNLLVEAAVVGLPDDLLGKKLIAIVVPKENDFNPKELMLKCGAGLPSHKIPADIVVTRTLPKNASGKIDHQKCVSMLLATTSPT